LGWLKRAMRDALLGKELAGGFRVDADENSVEVTGEATANNRRGKTIFLYELEVTIRWQEAGGDGAAATDGASGNCTFPYIGEDNEGEDWEAKVACTTSTLARDAKEAAATRFRTVALPALRKAIATCIAQMKEVFSSKKSGAALSASSPAPPPGVQVGAAAAAVPPPKPPGAQIEMVEKFVNTSPETLYELILDSQRMSMVTGGASIDRKPGGKFSLFNGAVVGEFIELVKDTKIVKKWRFASWPTEVPSSIVTMTFSQQRGDTIITFVQIGVPREDIERTETGWKENVWERIRMQFGFGGCPL